MASIELKNVSLKVLKQLVLDDVSFHIPHGKSVAVLGPQGSGKSALIKVLAGLTVPDTGEMLMGGYEMHTIPEGVRHIEMVFQNEKLCPYAQDTHFLSQLLFNKHKKESLTVMNERLADTSRLLDVESTSLSAKKIPKLSGDELQRVAVGRCIIRAPRLLLLDKPFADFDAPLREKYSLRLKKMLHAFNITTLYVTHNQYVASTLADEVIVVQQGRIAQMGAYATLYDNPCSVFVAEFLNANPDMPGITILPADLVKRGGSAQVVGIRPTQINVHSSMVENSVKVKIVSVTPASYQASDIIETDFSGHRIVVSVPKGSGFAQGGNLFVTFGSAFLFEKKTGRRAG